MVEVDRVVDARRPQGVALQRRVVLAMIKRRAAAAGLPPSTCCHTFRATGITADTVTVARPIHRTGRSLGTSATGTGPVTDDATRPAAMRFLAAEERRLRPLAPEREDPARARLAVEPDGREARGCQRDRHDQQHRRRSGGQASVASGRARRGADGGAPREPRFEERFAGRALRPGTERARWR